MCMVKHVYGQACVWSSMCMVKHVYMVKLVYGQACVWSTMCMDKHVYLQTESAALIHMLVHYQFRVSNMFLLIMDKQVWTSGASFV